LSLALLVVLPFGLEVWLNGRIAPDRLMAIALLLWVSVELVGKAISVFLHGMKMVVEQIWVALIFLPVCVASKLIFGHFWGAPGVIFGTTLAYVCVHAVPYWKLVVQWHKAHPSGS
jgi:hypothetical protein